LIGSIKLCVRGASLGAGLLLEGIVVGELNYRPEGNRS